MLQLPSKTICDSEKQPSSSSKKTSTIAKRAAQTPLESLSRKGLCTFLLTWLLF
jgi:hypothetical protein